jgi:hypothetical protein
MGQSLDFLHSWRTIKKSRKLKGLYLQAKNFDKKYKNIKTILKKHIFNKKTNENIKNS